MPVSITARIEDHGLEKTLALSSTKTRKRAWKIMRKVSFLLEKGIKTGAGFFEMPIDKGRARASWGHWSPGLLKKDAKDANEADAIWEENEGSLTVIQGTNVPYVAPLNEGHSTQAPAGFLEQNADIASTILGQEFSKLIDGVFK